MTYKVVVPISGGKDSQACLKLALETYCSDEVLGLFCDTKFEHPLNYKHIQYIRDYYGITLITVNAGDVISKVEKYGRFPSGVARFCTDELKIIPTKKVLKFLATNFGSFEVWYGMRTQESTDRKKRYVNKVCDEIYPPHEVMPSKYPKYLHKLGVSFRLAILDWSEREVFDFLEGTHNPLYDQDFDRVGCFPCLAAGDKTKEKAFSHDEFGRNQYEIVKFVSKQINKNVFTSKGGIERNHVCAVCSI